MGTGKSIQEFDIKDVSGGVNLADDISAVTKNQSPDSMNIEFSDGKIRKRGGVRAVNEAAYAYDCDVIYDADLEYNSGLLGTSVIGYSVEDFPNTSKYHQQVAHLDAGVYAFDRTLNSSITLRSNAPKVISYNAKVKNFLIQTYDNYAFPYYWDGAAASMSHLSTAPNFKRVIEFQGFLMGMNTEANKMRVYYQATTSVVGGAYSDYFTLTPAPNDDEITEPFILNGRLYAGSKYSIFRLSYVGGVTVFEQKQIISVVGVVPRTTQLVMTKEYGQVIFFLGTDKRIYMFDGANLKTVSDLFYSHNEDSPISLDLIDDNFVNNSFAVYDFPKKVYRLFVTKLGQTSNYYCLNVDTETFAFYPFDNMQYSAGCMGYDALLRPFLICLDNEGVLCKMFLDENKDKKTDINEYYTSPIVVAKSGFSQQSQDIILHIRPTSSANLLIHDRVDFRRAWQFRGSVPCAGSRDKFLGQNFVLGSSALGSERVVEQPRINPNVKFNYYQFKLYSDRAFATAWEIQQISVNSSALVFGKAEAQR